MDKFQKLAEFNKQYGESFCVKPFTEICNTTGGAVKLCCNSSTVIGRNERNGSPYAEIFYDDQRFADIREKISSGERVVQCKKCYYNEKVTGKSERITHSLNLKRKNPELFQKIVDENYVELKTMDIKFGNKCNLGCVMCDSGSSSTIGKERERHGIPDEISEIWDHNREHHFDSYEFEQLKKYAHTITSFSAKGGEPTLLPHFNEWIEFLSDNGHSKNINFLIVTNATVDLSPLVPKLKTFESFNIYWSVDAIDDLFRYVRWPATFDKVSKNHKRIIQASENYNNFIFGFSVVAHALNVDQMVKIAEYGDSLGNLHNISYNIAYDSPPLNPGVISAKTLKQFKLDVDNYCQGSGKFKDNLKNLYLKIEERFNEYHSNEDNLQDNLKKLEIMTKFWKKTRGLDAYDCVPSYKDTISQIK